MSSAQLDHASEQIRVGILPSFDPDEVTALAAAIRDKKLPVGCLVAAWILIAIAVSLSVTLIILRFI